MSESQESKLREKALLIVGRRGWDEKSWKRVLKRFSLCIEMNTKLDEREYDESMSELRGKVWNV